MRRIITFIMLACLVVITNAESVTAKSIITLNSKHKANRIDNVPNTTLRVHRTSTLTVPVTNWGVIGSPGGEIAPLFDPETGEKLYNGITYETRFSAASLLAGALWVGTVGGIRRSDTVVTTSDDAFTHRGPEFGQAEMYPTTREQGGDFVVLSNDQSSPLYDPSARAPIEFRCEYSDTLTDPAFVRPDPYALELHRPIGISVRQISYSWPFEHAEDIAIIQYWLRNITDRDLNEIWVGYFGKTQPYVGMEGNEIAGFRRTIPSLLGRGFEDTVMMVWVTDNDGDPYRCREWTVESKQGGFGIRFLGFGKEYTGKGTHLHYGFNWWAGHPIFTRDWGPQRIPPDVSMKGGYGTPIGDKQKFRMMSGGEVDYDQQYANEKYEGWIDPFGIKQFNERATYNIADGHNVQFMLSVGPFAIDANDSIPIGLAVVGGDRLHRSPTNCRNLADDPVSWYENLDFSDLDRNLQWASWIYDNPGVDTDDDGYFGGAIGGDKCRDTSIFFEEYCVELPGTVFCDTNHWWRIQVCDSLYYCGDGVPDLRTPPPPPAPKVEVHSETNRITLTWSGKASESFLDPFSQRRDFEGYNVYWGVGEDVNAMTYVCSWDITDYDRYRYTLSGDGYHWLADSPPLTLRELHDLYGPDFNPHDYADRHSVYKTSEGERFYFRPHGGNRGNAYIESGVIQTNPIQNIRTDSLFDAGRGEWVYFGEYRCIFENLLPSQPHYFAVTAYDQGYLAAEVEALESPIQENILKAYALNEPDEVDFQSLNVSVYPNPYKIDANYRGRGFEDPLKEGFKERERRIHFVNLPPECTIKIFSLDGDLIRQLHHPTSRFSDTPSHTAWDLITRNTQAVQSGIYLYTVESEWGTQVGKFVIIK